MIALGKGGALETVIDGETGLFFREEAVDSLCGAIAEFESRQWPAAACRANAARFAKAVFLEKMKGVIGWA